ncbi:terpenoid synthase [Aspergillus sclerotioniger CBS 115572]|uniref:Bifunctional lycopene cyclase/phytoene synthase n=1 Tax=Aspergillus sclerotioniger CBS 115572 TaxID=1450535 RepID=A0A317XG38_9EURO|nr:terpenoid synthase [Aspergillus sclerotioniger CBS 115572]PWY96158.1 terpenoid synthase [Aspergillus sclerotioniger CBS 115572]
MVLDYLFFHCTYTIPLATALTVLYYPFFTPQDLSKICILITIAVIATIPWDSYLIRTAIWTYPPDAVIGPTLFRIPIEEVFFFVIQTYTTSLVYCIFTKPLVRPIYLRSDGNKRLRNGVAVGILGLMSIGIACLLSGEWTTYLGLILVWVCPVLLFQWYVGSLSEGGCLLFRILSYPFLTALPWKQIVVSVCLPTMYLWIADARAMGTGTWRIESGTKISYQCYGLEVEEATFFLATNIMIVMGLAGCDYAFALEEYRGLSEPASKSSLKGAILGLIKPMPVDGRLVSALSQAVSCLKEKSQSMFLGSALFQGQLRIDLIFLYSFCRVVDDLIDEAENEHEARYWLTQCKNILDARMNNEHPDGQLKGGKYGTLCQSIDFLPLSRLSKEPLYDLLKGFEMDLGFNPEKGTFPIETERNLDQYTAYVAGTVGALVLDVIFSHCYHERTPRMAEIRNAGTEMGMAVQCVNIARDIRRDAAIGRVYIPTTWLNEVGLTPGDVLQSPSAPVIYELQNKMLQKADGYYRPSRVAIEELPIGVREPVRATAESYMEIGRLLRETKGKNLDRTTKLRVSLRGRLVVGWLAML